MREIKGYKPGTERPYVPTEFGNRDDPEPVRVWILEPTEGQKRDVSSDDHIIDVATDGEGEALKDEHGNLVLRMDIGRAWKRRKAFIERFVARVENYTGRAGPITNGHELAEHGEAPIVSEVAQEIEDALSLTEQEAKTSAEQSGSSRATIQPSAETVTNAPAEGNPRASIVTGKAPPDSATLPKQDTASSGAPSPG